MTKMIKILNAILFGLIILGMVTFLSIRYLKGHHAPSVAHTVIILDRSGSTTNQCASLVGMAEKSLSLSSINKGSMLVVIGTGDEAHRFEPVLLGSFPIPHSSRIIEGKSKIEKAKRDLLAAIADLCEQVTPSNDSPIALSIKRGIAQLRSFGCKNTDTCYITIQTDGLETLEPYMVNALRSKQPKKKRTAPVEKLDNTGIDIEFCGISQTVGNKLSKGKGKRSPKSRSAFSNTIEDAWKQTFVQPERVRFTPFCPKAELPKTLEPSNSGAEPTGSIH